MVWAGMDWEQLGDTCNINDEMPTNLSYESPGPIFKDPIIITTNSLIKQYFTTTVTWVH